MVRDAGGMKSYTHIDQLASSSAAYEHMDNTASGQIEPPVPHPSLLEERHVSFYFRDVLMP